MNVHAKINYRNWIIQHWLLNYHSLERIDWLKLQLLKKDHLQGFASTCLTYNSQTKGKSSYFKTALYDSIEMTKRKKLGCNFKGKRLGFGENINTLKL